MPDQPSEMKMILPNFHKTTRTYSTFERALAAVANLPAALDNQVSVMIQSDGKRFSPVFFLNNNSMWRAVAIASNGWRVVG